MEQVLINQNADKERIWDGSAESFAELLRSHQRLVRSFVARHLNSLDEADELSQEVFVAAFRSIDRYEGRGCVAAWLIGIARNHVLTHLRNKKNTPTLSLDQAINTMQLQCFDEDIFEADAEQERLKALQSCIESLGASQRDTLTSFYFEGESAEEIGVRFDKPAGTIRMMLLRIRKSLRNCIAGKLAAGGSFR